MVDLAAISLDNHKPVPWAHDVDGRLPCEVLSVTAWYCVAGVLVSLDKWCCRRHLTLLVCPLLSRKTVPWKPCSLWATSSM